MPLSVSSGQNLSGPLEHVAVSYRGPVVGIRSMRRVSLDRAAGRLAAYLDLILDEPQAVRGLRDAASELHDVPDLAAVLPHILGEAMSLMGAERGNIQLRDPSDGSLVLVTQSGFGAEFLDQFAVVDDGRSVCGLAARRCAQAVAPDVRDDPDYASHQSVFSTAGVRAVQSTPLLDHAGHMIGMISTHWPQPGYFRH